MLRLLHTADWQIGRTYDRFDPEDAAALSEARLTSVERVAELANREDVDAVLVAGDVFDAQTVSDRTIRRLFNALHGFKGPWVLLAGNHDAALAESVWTRAIRLNAVPSNVHLALEPAVLPFHELGMAVLTAPLTQRQTHHDLTAWFDHSDTPAGLLRIGLAHGSIQGVLAEHVDSSNPIAADRAARARLDYLALGDWHGLKSIDARTGYSGTHEPDRFKSNNPGHAVIVSFTEPGQAPTMTAHRTGQYQWHSWQRTLHTGSELDALIQELHSLTPDTVLDLTLAGSLNLNDQQRLANALSMAQGVCRSVSITQSDIRITPTDDDIQQLRADGYVGQTIEALRTLQEGEQPETAREALVLLAGFLQEVRESTPP